LLPHSNGEVPRHAGRWGHGHRKAWPLRRV